MADERFRGYTEEEIADQLKGRLGELNHTSSFTLLSALEAVFRIDYLQRVYKKKKDSLSREFRQLHHDKGNQVSLENDILEAWKKHARPVRPVSEAIGELKGALKYRHWLAHGRYWEPKMGRERYDYETVAEIAQRIMDSFPFEGV